MSRFPKLDILSPQKRIFVMEYLKDFKPYKAAERCGLSGSAGSGYLSQVEVQEAISEQMEERMERTQIDADWVLIQLARMWDADLGDIMDSNGAIKPVHEWPEIWRKICSGFKSREEFGEDPVSGAKAMIGYIKEIKHIDKLAVIKSIGQHTNVKAFTERIEVASDQDLINMLQAGRKRARRLNSDDDEEPSFM